jgi:fumarate reductase subunit C
VTTQGATSGLTPTMPPGGARAARREALLWVASRASAAVLALCVVVHLATMIFAVRGGLTAAEILGRTRGSVAWALFYGLGAVAAAVHAAIGMRTVLAEMARARGRTLDVAAFAFAVLLLAAGWRAVYAVTAG